MPQRIPSQEENEAINFCRTVLPEEWPLALVIGRHNSLPLYAGRGCTVTLFLQKEDNDTRGEYLDSGRQTLHIVPFVAHALDGSGTQAYPNLLRVSVEGG